MRAIFLLVLSASFGVACGSTGGTVPPNVDAGHDAAPPPPEDSGPPPPFDSGSTTTDADGCTGVGRAWAKMDHQPIFLADAKDRYHRVVAGVDIDGPAGGGATLPELEAILCPGSPLGRGPNSTRLEAWGVSNEVQAAYDPGSLVVEQVSLFPGYLGAMVLPTDPAGPDAGHTFRVGLGEVQKDGAPFVIDWHDLTFAAGNELFNAIAYNAVGYTGYYALSCMETSACAANTSTGRRQWQLLTVNAVLVFNLTGSADEQSTVVEIDLLP